MALSNVDNTAFDSALTTYNAAAKHPYGAVSRVDSVVNLDPNSQIEITCVCAGTSVNVELSYEDVVDIDEADRKVFETHAQSEINGPAGYAIRNTIDLLDAYFDLNIASPWVMSNQELQDVVRVLGPVLRLAARPEWRAYTEKYGPDAFNTVSVTAVDNTPAAVGNLGTITVDLGGQITHMLAILVDDVVEYTYTNVTDAQVVIAAHDFGTTGTFAVRAIAVGPGGIVDDTASVVISSA